MSLDSISSILLLVFGSLSFLRSHKFLTRENFIILSTDSKVYG